MTAKHNEARFAYTLATHSVEDVREYLERAGKEPPADGMPVMYCDSHGQCMFDEQRQPYVQALEALLNEQAEQGRRLVQVIFRERQMISIWEHRRGESEA